jgi:glucose-6-phosphate dehydrogenase assembly protein OpcA
MAEAVTEPVRCIAEWHGTRVRFEEVLDALGDLRHADRSLTTRTSVVTLIAVASSEAEAAEAMATVHRFGAHHPGRSVVVLSAPDSDDPHLDAKVSLTAVSEGDRPIWFEDVVLDARGPAAEHLDSLVEPLALPDVPLAIWFMRGYPEQADLEQPLLRSADVLVVDSRRAGGLDGIGAAIKRLPVIDLSWIRLRAWRLLLARAADAPGADAVISTVAEVIVAGSNGPRTLLTGWLRDRLGSGPTYRIGDGSAASARLESPAGVLEVHRIGRDPEVRAFAEVGGRTVHEERFSLPVADPVWALGQALGSLRRDPLYERAVAAALA